MEFHFLEGVTNIFHASVSLTDHLSTLSSLLLSVDLPSPLHDVPSLYLHGDCVFHQHGSQLSVQLKEHFPLAGLVQVTQSQRLDVEDLPPLQLHLRLDTGEKKK